MSSVEELKGTRREYRLKGYSAYPLVLAAVIAVLVPWIYSVDGVVPAALVAVLTILGSVYLCLGMQQSRLVVDGSRIEVRGMGQNRSVDLSEVAGTRTMSDRHSNYRVLCLKDGSRPIRFSQYATDGAFDSWLSQVPDLDGQEREHLLQEIAADEELGATPEARLAVLHPAKHFSIGLLIVAGVAAAGLIWGPAAWHAPCFWVVSAAPIAAAALLLRFPQLYTILQRNKDPRAELSPALFLAGFVLFVSASKINFVAGTGVLGASHGLLKDAGIVAFFWIAAFIRPAMRSAQVGSALVWVAVIGLSYCYGVTANANVVADYATPERYVTRVLEKYTTVSHGRGRSTIYHLRVQRWGPYPDGPMSMRVQRSVYTATHTNDLLCIQLHPGWLDAAWYEAAPCTPTRSQP